VASIPARPANFDGFVHANGPRLVDGGGTELLLRGVGIGNWLLPEGYMWKFGPGAEAPREIERLITDLVGSDAAEQFWRDFREAFFTEADIAAIAEHGFDHIRLPINSRIVMDEAGQLIEEGFLLIDQVINWCRDHRLWVLLDLHGAPGGQTGTNIDDSPNNRPELFMDDGYRDQTLALWRAIATRYAAETVVLGYDLLNEPIPNEWQHTYGSELAELYIDLTRVIREVDGDHLIVYEGSHWATNWDIFTEVWDENSMLQFHKYWSSPDLPSIQKFLDARDRLGLPIYMGEGGENNLGWLYAASRLYESQNIGWNFWPWKKIDTRTSPASITAPGEWELIRDRAHGGEAVAPDSAARILAELLHNMRLENCHWQQDIVNALLGFEPALMPAWAFGYRDDGYQVASGHPLETIRANDPVSIEYLEPRAVEANVFEHTDGREASRAETLVVRVQAGDWLHFEADADADAYVPLSPDGTRSPVVLTSTPTGIRATAREDALLWRLARYIDVHTNSQNG
jgi:endoglucanase